MSKTVEEQERSKVIKGHDGIGDAELRVGRAISTRVPWSRHVQGVGIIIK